MSLIAFQTYEGETVHINPESVLSVSTSKVFDHPEAGYAGKQTAEWAKAQFKAGKAASDSEFNPTQDIPVDYDDESRMSQRVVLTLAGGAIVVTGSLEDVLAQLQPATEEPKHK